MKNQLKPIAKEGSTYFIFNSLAKALGLILLPIYTRYFTPDDYGKLSMVEIIINLFIPIFSLSLISASSRFYFDYKENSKEQKQLLGNIFSFITMSGFVMFFIFLFLSKRYASIIFSDLPFFPFIIAGLSISLFRIFFNYKLNIYRAQQKAVRYGTLNLLFFSLNLVAAIIVVVVLKQSVEVKVITDMVLAFCLFILVCILLFKDIKLILSFQKIKSLLRYSAPLIPHELSGVIFTTIDRIFIASLISFQQVGIYSLAVKIALALSLLLEAFRLAYNPFYFKTASSNLSEGKRLFSRMATYLLLVLGFISIALIFFSKEIIMVISSKEYYEAQVILPVILSTYIFRGVYYFTVVGLFFQKKTYQVTIITFSTSIINIILNFFFIKALGSIGAAYATLISIFLSAVLSFYFSQRSIKIMYEYKRILILFSMIISYTLLYFLFISNLAVNVNTILLKLILILLFLVMLVVFNFFNKNEKIFIRETVQKLKF
ncbi:lipopolysaccharide biosynthesis protein [Bacteroidota bacterium]